MMSLWPLLEAMYLIKVENSFRPLSKKLFVFKSFQLVKQQTSEQRMSPLLTEKSAGLPDSSSCSP